MAEEGKGVALAILGIVAVIAVVGLVMLFNGAASGSGVYGGQMYQNWDNPMRQPGEDVGRYVSPVPNSEGGTFFKYRKGWPGLSNDQVRDWCPYEGYKTVASIVEMGGRQDCVPSPTRDKMFCCPAAGQAGAEYNQ